MDPHRWPVPDRPVGPDWWRAAARDERGAHPGAGVRAGSCARSANAVSSARWTPSWWPDPQRPTTHAGTRRRNAARTGPNSVDAVSRVGRYNPDAVVCVGPPFGHTRPQWIVPYGGTMTIDGTTRTIWADYS